MTRNGTRASTVEAPPTNGEDQLHALALEQQYLNPDASSLDPTLDAILKESTRRAAIIGSLRQRLQLEVQARLEAEKRAEIAETALDAIRGGKGTDQ